MTNSPSLADTLESINIQIVGIRQTLSEHTEEELAALISHDNFADLGTTLREIDDTLSTIADDILEELR